MFKGLKPGNIILGVAVVVAASSIAGAFASYTDARRWEQQVAVKQQEAAALREQATQERQRAASAVARSDSAQRRADAAAEAARRITLSRPVAEDCGPTCQRALAERDSLLEVKSGEVVELRTALDEQKAALARLMAADSAEQRAGQAEREATEAAKEAAKPSFFAAILPDIKFGPVVMVGEDLRPHAGVGVMLTW